MEILVQLFAALLRSPFAVNVATELLSDFADWLVALIA